MEDSRRRMEQILSRYPFKQTDANNNLHVKSELECLLHSRYLCECPETIINARYATSSASNHGQTTDIGAGSDCNINNGYYTISQPTPLQYFISSMTTTSTKRKRHEIEDIWCCIQLLLHNGALPASFLYVDANGNGNPNANGNSNKNNCNAAPPTFTLHLLHEFRRLMMEHVANQSVMHQRLNFFFDAIACNYNAQCVANSHAADDIQHSVITINCYDLHVWVMCDLYAEHNIDEAIPSPELLEVYLNQQFDIFHLFDSSRIGASYDYNEMARSRIPYKYKQSMMRHIIQTQLIESKRRKSVAKYFFVLREFNRKFRAKKVAEFSELVSDLEHTEWSMNHDLISLLLSFIYDDLQYLKYDCIEKDREFVNESLKMYTYLNTKWKRYIFNEYIKLLPKDALAKLDSFAYLCYL